MISVAMATYNGEKYLREQIDSILSQTYKDFELVISDDCSTDSTFEILKEYARKDKRIKIFKNEKNLGFKKKFENAISFCNGEYIALSDQDDIWLPKHLEILLENIRQKSMVSANAIMVDSNNCELGKLLNEVDSFFFLPENTKVLYRILLLHGPFQGAASLYKADFLKKLLPIPDKVNFHDAYFASCASLENGLLYLKTPILRYRQHGDNVTFQSHQIKKQMNFFNKIFQKIITFFKILFRKQKNYSDRFAYCQELKNRYGLENEDFKNIYDFILNIKNKKSIYKNIKVLWKNFDNIKTCKTHHKGFFRFLLQWKLTRGEE